MSSGRGPGRHGPLSSGKSTLKSAPMSPRAVRWLDVAIVSAFLGLVFLLGLTRQRDIDFWWHLRTGDLIRQGGQVPRTDWFTYGAAGHEWIDMQWGFQVLLSWGYQLGGIPLLTVAKSVVIVATVALLLAAPEKGWPLWAMVLAWMPALMLFSGRMLIRPETLTVLYLAAFLAILARVRQRPWLAWLLPPIQVAWVNSQGLFFLGPCVLF